MFFFPTVDFVGIQNRTRILPPRTSPRYVFTCFLPAGRVAGCASGHAGALQLAAQLGFGNDLDLALGIDLFLLFEKIEWSADFDNVLSR